MEAFLRSGYSFHTQVKAPSVCEIECGVAIDNTQRAQFVQYLRNIKQGIPGHAFEVVQRCDIAYRVGTEIHQCRVFFNGPEKLRTEYMKKDLLHEVRSNEASQRRMAVARETDLNQEPIPSDITDVKLKLRYMVPMKYWRIEFLAIHNIDRKTTAEIVARRKIYYNAPIADIDEFIAFVSNSMHFFSGYRIEYELLDNTKIVGEMREIIDEYNMIDKVIFGLEILALRYRECVRKIAAKYMHNPHECDTIKRITAQARPLTYGDFRTTNLEGYYVSEKADGVHAVAYSDDNECFMLESVMHIFKAGVTSHATNTADNTVVGSGQRHNPGRGVNVDNSLSPVVTGVDTNRQRQPPTSAFYTIADGEYIANVKGDGALPMFLVFDVIAIDGVCINSALFSERVVSIGRCVEIFAREMQGRVKVVDKVFRLLPNPELPSALSPTGMTYRETILKTIADAEKHPYENDGLIFVEPGKPYLSTTIYKWKQGELNTIDFLARSPSKGIDLRDRTPARGMNAYMLYCTISTAQFNALVHPHQYTMMFDMKLFTNVRPVLFAPSIATDLNLLTIDRDDLDNKIIELSPIWIDERGQLVAKRTETSRIGWKFVRIRTDRDADFRSGKYFGNYYANAEQTLLSFVYPITLDMLLSTNGNEQYFVTARDKMYEGAAKFNNTIKADMFKRYCNGVQYHLDLAGGRGSDINNYFENIAQKVFIVEVDQAAIQEMIERKRRYLSSVDKPKPGDDRLKRAKLPSLMIVEQDLRKPYEMTLAKIRMYGPPVEEKQMLFDTASSHFAMHYFTRTEAERVNVARLIKQCLKPGGLFMFTMFNAPKVRALIASGSWEFRLDDGRLKYRIERTDGYPETIKLVLPFTGGEMIDEVLVNIDDIITAFTNIGFTVVENSNFSEAFNTHLKARARLDTGDSIFCGLYNAVVLKAPVRTTS